LPSEAARKRSARCWTNWGLCAAGKLAPYALTRGESSCSRHCRSLSPSEDKATSNEEEAPPTKRFKDGDYVNNNEEEVAHIVTEAEATARRSARRATPSARYAPSRPHIRRSPSAA
jgi:hypothetical protein